LITSYYFSLCAGLPIVLDWFPYISLIRWTYEGLCINEFAGETFVCDTGTITSCITTGEQVLQSLAFDGHTVDYAMFGESMVMLGFLVLGYIFLVRSEPSYLPLDFKGRKFKKFIAAAEPEAPRGSQYMVVSSTSDPPQYSEDSAKRAMARSASIGKLEGDSTPEAATEQKEDSAAVHDPSEANLTV
jgi:hypothetical protein